MLVKFVWLCGAIGAVYLAVAWSRHDMTILAATYGGNCGAPSGNATASVATACDGKSTCNYQVDINRLGDPASACSKDFRVTWRCATEEGVRTVVAPPEAGLGAILSLRCAGAPPARIEVLAVRQDGYDVGDMTAESVAACGGTRTCQFSPTLWGTDRAGAERPPLTVGWRCEGEMAIRSTTLTAPFSGVLSCR
jgi:hypothetical protein